MRGVFVPSFGHLAFTPRAAADLALRFDAPVALGTSKRWSDRPGERHEVQAVEIPATAPRPT